MTETLELLPKIELRMSTLDDLLEQHHVEGAGLLLAATVLHALALCMDSAAGPKLERVAGWLQECAKTVE